ncbi:DUF4097 domain-containing protein [Isoptericola sp. 4D.3]|uniref:DUF4097 domain-containing protein n=1 Tax=Isoptericola peretonis TaxID=2918523 RepID=A0ABT0J7C3_9MICO|nr:DUF4097 domain-containing protein [Isoptericola sp. 4D.3]
MTQPTIPLSPETPTPAPEGAPPAPGRGPTARVLLVAGVVLGAVAVLWVAVFLVDLALSRTTTQHASYAATGSVELVADGDVTVRVAEGGVEVDRVAHSGLTAPEYEARESAAGLVVTHECARWLWVASSRCSGDLEVTLPADTELVVRSSNGDVLATGLAGAADLRSSNGDVEATEVTGDLTLDTSNGDVQVAGAGADVDVYSSNGGIEVTDVGGSLDAVTSNGEIEVAGVAGDVRAESSNGDVTVTGDGEPVVLTLETSNGSQTSEGPTDPAADRTVEVRSSNGDVAYLLP